jgi:hypothetical protein
MVAAVGMASHELEERALQQAQDQTQGRVNGHAHPMADPYPADPMYPDEGFDDL